MIEPRPLIDKSQLSEQDKSLISAEYEKIFGRKLDASGNCNDCYRDAIIEIFGHDSQESPLLPGEVIEYNGRYYTRKTKLPSKLIEKLKKEGRL